MQVKIILSILAAIVFIVAVYRISFYLSILICILAIVVPTAYVIISYAKKKWSSMRIFATHEVNKPRLHKFTYNG